LTAISIFLGLALFLSCVFFSLARCRKYTHITLIEWAILGIGLIYGLGWALVIGLTSVGYNARWSYHILPFKDYFLIHNLLAFLLAFCVIVGWLIGGRVYRMGTRLSSVHFSFGPDRLHLYAWILLAISICLRWFYVQAFGGFIEYLEYSNAIRSGIFQIYNKWSFLEPFSGVAIFSTFLFVAALLDGRRNIIKIIGFILSSSFSFYVLYSQLGRIGFLVFGSTILLSVLYFKEIKPRLLIIGSLFGTGTMMILAYTISQNLDLKGADSIQEFVSRELCFPFVSFFAQLDHGEYLYLWFRDFIFSPLYLLPSSWWGQWFDEISQINTQLVLGARKGDYGVTGGMPVDLITLGLMQSSFSGIFVVGALFGVMLRFVQGFIDGIAFDGLRALLWAYLSIRVSILSIAYAQPHHLISGTFGILVSIVLIFIFVKLTKTRISS